MRRQIEWLSVRALAVFGGCLLGASSVSAQTPATPSPADAGQVATAAPADTAAPTSGPTVSFRGFADINYASTSNDHSDDGKSADGFSLGNLVGHVSASLGHKLSFYTEVVVTQRPDSFGFDLDIARAILRYDYSDRFKISVGRYHAPVSYWNTAFHRGTWLQTTIFRPDIVKEQFFQPDHFLGVVAEGTLWPTTGLGYTVGYGNGRDGDLLLAGDSGGSSHHRAYVAKLFARPPQVSGIEFGGAAYHDVIAVAQTPGDVTSAISFPELILSGYIAITREPPELIAEFSQVRHHDPATGRDVDSHAFYVQGGYRIPQAPAWKPYARFEKAVDPVDEPVFGGLSNSKTTVGLRCELTDSTAVKVEFAQRRRPGETQHINGVFVQTAFTF